MKPVDDSAMSSIGGGRRGGGIKQDEGFHPVMSLWKGVEVEVGVEGKYPPKKKKWNMCCNEFH